MRQIGVTMVVDAEALIKSGDGSQDPEKPTAAPSGSTIMVKSQDNSISGNVSEPLHLSIHPGDATFWQSIGSTVTPTYTVAIYQFVCAQGGEVFDTPQLNVPDVQLYYPTDTSKPLVFSSQQVYEPYWSATASKAGDATYSIYFAILSVENAKPVGYYSVDVQITVIQPQPPKMINVLSVVDARTIVALGPGSQDPSKPTEAPNHTVFMVTDQADALFGNGSGGLRVSAEPGNAICWQASSLALPTAFTIVLCGVQITSGQSLLTAPQLSDGSASYPVPKPDRPVEWTLQPGPLCYWAAQTLTLGAVSYQLLFAILDAQAQLQGYYCWDAHLLITTAGGQGTAPNQEVSPATTSG